jgi:DNA-binding XRE family transcriptional regulator
MARLSKADAARQLGIARSTLYKLIDQGKVSPTPDGLIDQAELVRVAASVDAFAGRSRTSADILADTAPRQVETPYGRPRTDVREQQRTDTYGRPQTPSDVLVEVLREQLQDLRAQLEDARHQAQSALEREVRLT